MLASNCLPRRALAALGTLVLAQCTPLGGDRVTSPAGSGQFSLHLQVGATSVARSGQLTAYFQPPAGAAQVLATSTVSLTPGTVQVPFSVDIAPCLTALNADSCPVLVAVALRDQAGALLDSTLVGPLAARSGASATPVAVSFAVPASVSVAVPDSIRAGDNLPLTATVRDSSNAVLTGRAVTWTSSDPTVATVSAAGVLTALRPGPVQLIASTPTASATVSRTVLPDVATVTLTAPTTIRFNDSVVVAVEARDRRGQLVTGLPVSWTSSDATVATVSANNRLVLNAAGAVTLDAIVAGRKGSLIRTIRGEGLRNLFANYAYVCGVGTSGRVYCWNRGNVQNGFENAERLVPTLVPSDSLFTNIAGGVGHLCGLTRSGVIMCIGNTSGIVNGQLAVGDIQPRTRMTLTVGAPGPFVELHAGAQQTSGREASGAVWCAGPTGRIGIGRTDFQPQTSFARVQGPNMQSLSGAGVVTCGLSGPTPWCWTAGLLSPMDANLLSGSNVGLPMSLNLGTLAPSAITPINPGACVLAAGDAYCWGPNTVGQAGVGDTLPRTTPQRALMPGGVSFTRVIGSAAAVCGLGNAQLYCWGLVPGLGALRVPTLVNTPVTPTNAVASSALCIETADFEPWCQGAAPGDGSLSSPTFVKVRLPGERPPP